MHQPKPDAYYVNPLTNDDFPDPCVIKVRNQGYFAFGTHDEFSPSLSNILIKHSWDLVNWSESKGALREPPRWAQHSQRYWCPHVVQVNDQFRLYYATEPDTKDGMCLALATSDRPEDFVDCGEPINRVAGSTYQMIDPCFFIDPVSHRHLLYYGSAHEPIRVVELAPDGITFVSTPKEVLYPGEGTYHRLREAAFVTYDPRWKRYFLWVSGDNTWATNSYAVSVFWSDVPDGLFREVPGEHLIIRPNEVWDSPGHNCIIEDEAGDHWILYHAVDRQDPYIPHTDRFLRKMCMDKILYTEDGWPYVENNSPSFSKQKAPVVQEH